MVCDLWCEVMSEEFESGSKGPDSPEHNTPLDPIDAELQDLVEETGPISKEAELLADLQRLQAEFVNFKTRVERDRE